MTTPSTSPPMAIPGVQQVSKLQLPPSCDPPTTSNPPRQRVWVIFGTTGPLGQAIADAALAHGDRVTAVSRSQPEKIGTSKKGGASSNGENHGRDPKLVSHHANEPSQSSLSLQCDIRMRSAVAMVFQKSLERWGRYDIVVNCAGYGLIGPCEEQDEFEIRDQFEINFWGTMNILQLSLPYFRARAEHHTPDSDNVGDDGDDDDAEAGRYLIFSSAGGTLGSPGLGPYCATKHAVEGLVASLLYETGNCNIKATLVEPPLTTADNESPAFLSTAQSKHEANTHRRRASEDFSKLALSPHSVYANPTSPAHHALRMSQWLDARQPGSASRVADVVWQLGHCRFLPSSLPLGVSAVDSVRERMKNVTEETEDWKGLNFPINNGLGGGEFVENKREEGGTDDDPDEDESQEHYVKLEAKAET